MSVKKRGAVWYYDFQIRGQRYRGALREARTKAQAQQAETVLRNDVFEQRFNRLREVPTVAAFIEKTYLPWARDNKKSAEVDERICVVIKKYFGKQPVNAVNALDVAKWRRIRFTTPTKHGRQRATATVNRELSVLSGILTLAVEAGHLESNPARRVKTWKLNNARMRWLSEAEEARLLAALEGHEPLRMIVELALATGLRRGEIYNLRWADVDERRGVLHIRQTKTEHDRALPLLPLQPILARARWHCPAESEWIFPSPRTGKRLIDLKRSFVLACERAGVDDFHFHDLRHTCASRLAAQGVDAFTIAEILGHRRLETTKRYTHSGLERQEQALARLSGGASASQKQLRPDLRLVVNS